MTTPAPQQQQQQKPPPQQPPPPATIPPQTLAAMVLPLAGLLLTAVSAAAVIAALKLRFRLAVLTALFWLAMFLILSRIVLAQPPPVTGTVGPASEQTSRLNAARRAQFVISATMRVLRAMLAARAHGENVIRAGLNQVERERRYYELHLQAMWNRAVAAAKVDMAVLEYGPLLGWAAVLDSRTSPECRAANGKNFYASAMPFIGYPGAVHPHCRCYATSPHPGASLLPSSGKFRRANSPQMRMAAAS